MKRKTEKILNYLCLQWPGRQTRPKETQKRSQEYSSKGFKESELQHKQQTRYFSFRFQRTDGHFELQSCCAEREQGYHFCTIENKFIINIYQLLGDRNQSIQINYFKIYSPFLTYYYLKNLFDHKCIMTDNLGSYFTQYILSHMSFFRVYNKNLKL